MGAVCNLSEPRLKPSDMPMLRNPTAHSTHQNISDSIWLLWFVDLRLTVTSFSPGEKDSRRCYFIPFWVRPAESHRIAQWAFLLLCFIHQVGMEAALKFFSRKFWKTRHSTLSISSVEWVSWFWGFLLFPPLLFVAAVTFAGAFSTHCQSWCGVAQYTPTATVLSAAFITECSERAS